MDEETRNIELMKISALLTLSRCVLDASPIPFDQNETTKKVNGFFREYMDGFRSDLSESIPQKTSQEAL